MFIHRIVLIHLCFYLFLATHLDAFGEIKPGCPEKCGNVTIPYPFGISNEGKGGGCSIPGVGYGYDVNCDSSYDPPKPFIGTGNFEILSISETEIRVSNTNHSIAKVCYNIRGDVVRNDSIINTSVQRTSFTFSDRKNRFFLIGCNSVAANKGFDQENRDYSSKCISLCESRGKVAEGSCSGSGCCQSTIPKGIKSFETRVSGSDNPNITNFLSFSPCSYAFVGEYEKFNFSASDLLAVPEDKAIPIVVDWAIGNKTCEESQRDLTTYACHGNSHCNNSDNSPGYRCTCFDGYKGNPYFSPGCIDINECEDEKNNPCEGKCINTNGSFNCICPAGTQGDGKKDGRGCIRRVPIIQVTLGIGLGLLFLIITSSWVYLVIRKRKLIEMERKLIEMKERFFQQNGGLILQQQLSSNEDGAENSKIFTAEELKLATNNYDDSLIVGRGGYGIVYKGSLSDNRIVAIKKSKIVDQNQIEQFINELVILTQVNHRNVVKLLGCCLETEVPMLVYEYISNGTLFERIHPSRGEPSISWASRLRIAVETAGALAYLHSAASVPIIHRDIKSTNILLDENYIAKVADFGASRLIPLDQTELSTQVLGTLGYLDPEYFDTSQLTEKSDVYSFGVVLVELLTAEMPISKARSSKQVSLAPYFISSMQENKLFQLLDARVRNEGTPKQVIAVAEFAKRCLSLKGEDRPTMRQVTTELERLREAENEAWSLPPNTEHKSSLQFEPTDLYSVPVTGSATGESGQYSLYTTDSGQYTSNTDNTVQMSMPR
ncbi:hypothetical protein C5167_001146 [Papaver somniferum]|uniref:Protein kinase domain-containing protein n=1 Tax=Papaver somniferum TaxID=3469 RepID=A0A4Y7KTY4_PAPSO|nr:hypothetical protein C5167_001146 [Papaver somniferum]